MRGRVAVQGSDNNTLTRHCNVSAIGDHRIVCGQRNPQHLPNQQKYRWTTAQATNNDQSSLLKDGIANFSFFASCSNLQLRALTERLR